MPQGVVAIGELAGVSCRVQRALAWWRPDASRYHVILSPLTSADTMHSQASTRDTVGGIADHEVYEVVECGPFTQSPLS